MLFCTLPIAITLEIAGIEYARAVHFMMRVNSRALCSVCDEHLQRLSQVLVHLYAMRQLLQLLAALSHVVVQNINSL